MTRESKIQSDIPEKAWEGLSETLSGALTSADHSVLAAYSDGRNHPPGRVIRIQNTRMLADTVKTAREHGIPLYPVSSAPPHYRSLLNMSPGSWILDFSGMGNVLKINRRNRMAMFEAGVTFEQLNPQVRREGLRLMLPLMPRQGKSILASYSDREPTIYPRYQWDLSDPLLCMEIVYGTGDIFRTGAAAGPGSIEEQWAVGDYQKSPMGPGQNDWYRMIQGAQGTIALATWASAKCEVKPEIEKLSVAGSETLPALLEASYRMLYRKLTDIHFILDRHAFASLIAKTPEQYQEASRQVGKWNLIYSISGIHYFPEERIKYLSRETEKEVKHQNAKIIPVPLIGEAPLLGMLQKPNALTPEKKNMLAAGFPEEKHWKDRLYGTHGEIYFQTTLDRAAHLVGKMDQLADEAGIDEERKGIYIQPQLGGRCCHVEFILAAEQQELDKIREFCDRAAAPMVAEGAFFSRPHGQWAGPAMGGASSSVDIFHKIKNIFDPDGILAPGRLMMGGERHA